jgi:uncharacterized coiled-coil protein SlyX
MGVKSFHCDNISQEFEDSQITIVKDWIEKRDSIIAEQQTKLDSLGLELTTAKQDTTTLQSKVDELTGQLETAQAELSKRSDSSDIGAYIKARRHLERLVCDRIDGLSDSELDNLNDRQLKEKLIVQNYDFKDLSTRSDEAINGMFDMAVKYSDSTRFDAKKSQVGAKSSCEEDEENFDMAKILKDKADKSRAMLFGGGK